MKDGFRILFVVCLFCARAAWTQISSPAAPGRSPASLPGRVPAPTAAIGPVQGPASVKLGGSDRWIEAKDGLRLTPGSEVRTLGRSLVVVAFSNGTKLRLGPNSNFRLQETTPARVSVFMGLGRLEAWVKGLAGGTFRARTPVAVASVRGTVFAMTVLDEKRMTLELFSGALDLADNYGGVTHVPAGQQLEANASAGVTGMTPLPPSAAAPSEPEAELPPPSKQPEGQREAKTEEAPDEVPADLAPGAPPPTPAQETTTVSQPCIPSVSPLVTCP